MTRNTRHTTTTTNNQLGDTIEDTVVHLKDKKNSGKLTILRAKLKELVLI